MKTIRDDQHVYQQAFEAVDTPERIFSLLTSIMDNDASLKVVADKRDEIFDTTMLEIDFKRKLLILKKIEYIYGHLMVIDAKQLTIVSQHDDVEINFASHLRRYSARNEGFYEILFPTIVKYRQRRMPHRAHDSGVCEQPR